MIANAPTTDGLGKSYGTFSSLQKFLSKRPPASHPASNFFVSLTYFILTHNYGTVSRRGMSVGKVEVLLVVRGFDVDGGAEVRHVNKDVNIQEGDMGR